MAGTGYDDSDGEVITMSAALDKIQELKDRINGEMADRDRQLGEAWDEIRKEIYALQEMVVAENRNEAITARFQASGLVAFAGVVKNQRNVLARLLTSLEELEQ